jgi:hypothetical protein
MRVLVASDTQKSLDAMWHAYRECSNSSSCAETPPDTIICRTTLRNSKRAFPSYVLNSTLTPSSRKLSNTAIKLSGSRDSRSRSCVMTVPIFPARQSASRLCNAGRSCPTLAYHSKRALRFCTSTFGQAAWGQERPTTTAYRDLTERKLLLTVSHDLRGRLGRSS